MPVNQLSRADPDGTVLGQSATDLVGFHGATPTARGAAVINAVDATTVIARLNELLVIMRAKGLIAP